MSTGHHVPLLAVGVTLRPVPEQAARRVPGTAAHRVAHLLGDAAVVIGHRRQAERALQFGRALQGIDELQRDDRRVPLRAARRNTAIPTTGPVHVWPPRNRTEHPGFVQSSLEPVEDRPNPWKEAAHVLRVVAMHPVVVHHRDPDRGERRNVLTEVGGVAAGGDSLGDPRDVKMLDRLAHETIVVAHGERDQRLDARVADVLELFVVRACRNTSPTRRAAHRAS